MKLLTSLTLIIGSLFLSACESEPKVGMTEKKWLRDTVLSDLDYTEGRVKAYRSNRLYYYFRDGVLVKIDPGWIPAQKIADLDLSTSMKAPFDASAELKKLDELRRDRVITEAEFQAEKKKILERKE